MYLANVLYTYQQVLIADRLFAKDIIVPQLVPSKYMDLVAVMLRWWLSFLKTDMPPENQWLEDVFPTPTEIVPL